jgi:hypothetical protein
MHPPAEAAVPQLLPPGSAVDPGGRSASVRRGPPRR